MPDTLLQTPSLLKPDLSTRQSLSPMPASLPRFVGVISCASPTAARPLHLPERRKKFRNRRLDIVENVTVQIADTPKLQREATDLLRIRYRSLGFDTAFIDNSTNALNSRLLTLLAMKGGRASGTCSLMLDRPGLGLSSDQNHKNYANVLRREGKCLIELSGLTVSSELTDSSGRVVLAALFSLIALCASYFLDYRPYLVIEVNPRHTSYWKNLGFVVLVENSWCERVNQPSAFFWL